jgi:hypothetical protein
MIDHEQLRKHIIRPTLKFFNLFSKSAEELLILTCAQESKGGTYLHQIKGPALGIYQMEPATHDDIWINFLKYATKLRNDIYSYMDIETMDIPSKYLMVGNLYYATIMSRLHYLRVSEDLPGSSDVVGLAKYWNKYYNRNPDKGTDEEAIRSYMEYVR